MAKQTDPWKMEENEWYRQAQEAANALRERPAFSYAPAQDPLYQAAKDQILQQGRRAMEDTVGKTAGLSGGYASSYAQSLGTQAYDRQLTRLAELLPDYYAQARSAYDKQTAQLQDALGNALGLYDKAYQAWLQQQDAQTRQEEAAAQQAKWDREFEENHARWAAEYEQNERKLEAQKAKDQLDAELALQRLTAQQRDEELEAQRQAEQRAGSAAEKERSYAYQMAMLALQQGLSVSDALLRTAGIDKAYAESIRRYYAALRR